jgi:hypothetical protein
MLDLVARYVDVSKYAIHVGGRRETREEGIARVMEMHATRYADKMDQLRPDFTEAWDAMDRGEILGSQRARQFGGAPILNKHQRIYNCSLTHANRPRVFQEVFHLLLCGCGVGFSVQARHVERLPKVRRPTGPALTYQIQDTIEGWADAFGVLVSSYFEDDQPFADWAGTPVVFDGSLIRPAGAPISSGSKAPGPGPLLAALERARMRLDQVTSTRNRLDPLDVYDLLMFAADAVLAGGVRRSATIALFSPEDDDMARAKAYPGWHEQHPQRQRSNNSAALLRDSTDWLTFCRLMDLARTWFDPGAYWMDHPDLVCNPCQPAWATVLTPNGISTIGALQVGDLIWTGKRFAPVAAKWATGVKEVYAHRTTAGVFYGTANHRVVQDGEKIEARDAEAIDIVCGPTAEPVEFDPQAILDGLVIGDGTYHGASGRVLLNIGDGDGEYHVDPGLAPLIVDRYSSGPKTWIVRTTIEPHEVPLTYLREVPIRFLQGDRRRVLSFLRGLYGANGSVCTSRVTLKQASRKLIDQVQCMLSAVGIRSYVTTNRAHDVEFANGTYECRESYDLNITTDRDLFAALIGFIQSDKRERLAPHLGKNSKAKKTAYDIVARDLVSIEEVYDITVDDPDHVYWTGGLLVSNCGEVACFPALDVPLAELSIWSARLPPGSRSGIVVNVVNEAEQFASLPGVQFCNLSTINGGRVRNLGDFVRFARCAAFLGTLQAGYTDFPYLGPATEEITRAEALLGVSITGLADNPDVLFDPATLEAGAAEVRRTNDRIAAVIGINPAARLCALKPEGTGTLTLGTLAKGVTPWHSRRGILHIRASVLETPFQFYATHNPHAVRELAPSDPNRGNTKVLAFAFEAPPGAATKDDVDTWELLRRVQLLRRHWVEPGTVEERCVRPWLRHNVSNTVHVSSEDWTRAARYVYDNRVDFAGVTFALSESGDKVYHLSPHVGVLLWEEQVEKYGIGVASSARCLIECCERYGVDPWFPLESRPISWPVSTLATCWETLVFAVDPDSTPAPPSEAAIDRAVEAAKDALFLRQFDQLRALTREVDWTEMREAEDLIDFGAEAACSGGTCLVDYDSLAPAPIPVGK